MKVGIGKFAGEIVIGTIREMDFADEQCKHE